MNWSLLALIGADLGDLFLVGDRLGQRLPVGDGRLHGLLDAAADGRRIAAGGDVPQPFAEDRPGQHGGRGGAVAGHVRGLRGDLVDQLGAHVLEAVFQLDFLADGDAVLGDGRPAEGLVEDHVAAGRTHGHGDGVGQLLDSPEHPLRA